MEDPRQRLEAERKIDEVTEAFFAAISFDETTPPVYERLPDLFTAPGVLVNAAGNKPQAEDLATFLSARQATHRSGTLSRYRVAARSGVTELFGAVAQRSSIFMRTGTCNGHDFECCGAIFCLYIRSGDQWKLSVVAWDDQRPGQPLTTCHEVDEFG